MADTEFISLELSRRGGSPNSESSPIELIEQLQILLRGIALHAVESGPENLEQFRHNMAEVANALSKKSSAHDLLIAIGRALRLTEEYNRQATAVFKGQMAELRSMLTNMAETVQFIVSSSEVSVKQLAFMETQLQAANGLQDLRQLKTYTSACLSLVRRESVRLQTETQTKIAALKSNVEQLSLSLKAAAVEESVDPVTGLHARAAAEQAIENKMSAGKAFLAALFVMDRLPSINGRFGHSVGNDVVIGSAHLLAQKLSGATLYRWSGPAFLAIFDPSIGSGEAEKRARQAAAQQLQKEINADDRMVMIVAGFLCQTKHIVPQQTTPNAIFDDMDTYLSSVATESNCKSA